MRCKLFLDGNANTPYCTTNSLAKHKAASLQLTCRAERLVESAIVQYMAEKKQTRRLACLIEMILLTIGPSRKGLVLGPEIERLDFWGPPRKT